MDFINHLGIRASRDGWNTSQPADTGTSIWPQRRTPLERISDETPGSPEREPIIHTTLVNGLRFSWAPQKVPSKVKLRKKINLWPLRLTLGADYDVQKKEWEGVCSCKDKLLGGRLSINIPQKHFDYRKSISVGGTSVLSFRSACTYTEAGMWRTSIGVVMEPVHGTEAVAALNSFDIRTKVPLAPALRAEIRGSVTLPLPAAEYAADSEGLSISLGQGGFLLHVAQVNAIIRL